MGRLIAPALLFVLGALAMVAGEHRLYANCLLAVLLALWTLATIAVRNHQMARTPAVASVSAAHLAQQAREQRRLTAYLNLSPAPLVTLDGEGRLAAVNRAARRLFNCDDLVPTPPTGLVSAVEAAVPGRSASVHLTIAGEARTFALATADLAGGGPGMRIAALVDIGAELRAAEASALRDLLQVLSHEIMNALTPIASLGRTAADMLADSDDAAGQAAHDAVETVARRAEGLQRFTSAYRDLARLPSPVVQRVPLGPLIADLEQMATARWPATHFITELDRAPRVLVADPDQFHAATWAVVHNAAEAAGEGGIVALKIAATPEGMVVAITDDGPGIDDAVAASIFQPFFTTKPSGNGVGLALVRQILAAHQGQVSVDSRPGATRFVMEWPG